MSRHTDPCDGSLNSSYRGARRSCTPDGLEDSSNRTDGAAAATHGTPHKGGTDGAHTTATATASHGNTSGNARHLMTRYKALINDIVVALSQPANLPTIDDFISLTEDALRGFRTVKMESRATLRRLQSNPLPIPRREVDDASAPGGQQTPSKSAPTAAQQDGLPPPAPPVLDPAATTSPQAVTSKPKSYMAALKARQMSPVHSARRPSPTAAGARASKAEELEKRAADLTAEKVAEVRDSSVLRGAERHRQAEERRKELQDGKLAKLEEDKERSQQAKQRREAAHDKIKTETKERQETAAKRADDTKAAVKEKAQRSNSRVEEVRFVSDLQQKNLALKLEMRMSEAEQNHEQRREETVRQLREKNLEAQTAAAERHRDLSQARVERHQQREAQRQENLKRLEEQKRAGTEQKHQRAEEREKKMQAQLLVAHAEAEARKARSEERINQSVQLREEQREKQKQRQAEKEQKLKEARDRRDREEALAKPTFQEVMPALTQAEEEQTCARLTRSTAAAQRQAKTFLEQYQKESTLATKDVNKSRLRPIFSRMTTTNLTQTRQPLHDAVVAADLTDIDHEYVRFGNGFEVVVKILIEARKAHDMSTFKLCSDLLHRYMMDAVEGPAHIRFFIRAGHLMSIIVVVYEEMKTLRKHNKSITLTSLLSLASLCVSCIVSDPHPTPKLVSIRDQVMSDLDVVGLDRFCIAVASTCVDEDDMPCLQYALLILFNELLYASKKKTGDAAGASSTTWLASAVTALFTLLQNILTPGGQPLKPQALLSPLTQCVLFTALRVLTTIARWKLDSLQDFLRGGGRDPTEVGTSATASSGEAASSQLAAPATRNELFHIVSSFFQYVASHDETLERLQSASSEGDGALHSFAEALQFGVTLSSMPRIPLPSSCSVEGGLPSARGKPESAVASGSFAGPSATQGGGYLRAALHELLLLVGYVTLCDTATQEIFSWGKDRPLLSLVLQSLPMQYFTQLRHVLFPTLLSVIHRDDRNKIILSREMDVATVRTFLQEEFDALPTKGKQLSHLYHDQQVKQEEEQRAASAAAPSATPPPPKPTLPKRSWAEMDDDDDDEGPIRIPSPGHPAGKTAPAAVSTAVMPEKQKVHAEKERLAKALKAIPPGLAHFRLDRRFPPNMWYDALVFLEKDLPPPAPQF